MAKNQLYVKNALRNQLKKERKEQIDWIFYDSLLTTVSITQTLTFFQQAIGGVGRARTNMKSAGQLPSPQSFTVLELGFYIINADGTSFYYSGGAGPAIHPLNAMWNQASFDITVEPKVLYEGHGFQIWKQKDYLNDTAAVLAVNGNVEGTHRSVKFNNPILIPSMRSFSVELSLTAPAAAQGYTAANSKIYCYLRGWLRRNAS